MTTNNGSSQSNGFSGNSASEAQKTPVSPANSSRKNVKTKPDSPSVETQFVVDNVPFVPEKPPEETPEETQPNYSVQDALRDAAKAQREAKKQEQSSGKDSPESDAQSPDLNQQQQDPQQQIDELLSGDSIISNVQKRTQQELLEALRLQRQEDLEILQRGILSGARKRDIYAAGEQLGFARAGNQASILDLLSQVEAIGQLAAQKDLPEPVQEKLPEQLSAELPDIDRSIDALLGQTLALRPEGKPPLALGGQRITAPRLLLAPTQNQS